MSEENSVKYGANMVQDGEGSSLAAWESSGVTISGGFKLKSGSMSQTIEITDKNRSDEYLVKFEIREIVSYSSYILIKYTRRNEDVATYMIPITSIGEQSLTLKVQEGGVEMRVQLRGSFTIGDISIQNNTGLSEQLNLSIADLFEGDTITANVMIGTACWFNTVSVNYLETNFTALDKRYPFPTGGVRNFQRIYDERQEFVTQTLSDTEFEDYTIVDPADVNKRNRVNVYYNAIGNHEDAYKAYTLTHPTKLYPELTEEQVEQFKVKTRKVLTESIKLSREFREITVGSGHKAVMPAEVWGAGDVEGQRRNTALIYKDTVGYNIEYYKKDGGVVKFTVGENGVIGAGVGGMLESLEFYKNGFVVNGQTSFKWVDNGLQVNGGKIIPITDTGQSLP